MKSKRNIGLLMVIAALLHTSTAYSESPPPYDWVFVYYMSYDNNLSVYGEVILSELGKGVIDSNIAVVVQADFRGNEGMRRISLSHVNGKLEREENILQSEDSADEGEFEKYLDWVRKNWRAKNYAVVFLDHGGELNGMCFDEKPLKNAEENADFASSGKWLDAMKTGEMCKQFQQTTEGKVRLLFLQQCGRGSIENIYNFADSADYIMASPVIVGAPNTYYTKTVQYVARNPNIGGEKLAQSIMKEDQHYSVYTLVDNRELRILPNKLQDLFDALKQVEKIDAGNFKKAFWFNDETNYDLEAFLPNIAGANNATARRAIDDFSIWYRKKLIVERSERKKHSVKLSGLSVFIPANRQQLQRYLFLPLYKQTDIEEVLESILEDDTIGK